MNIKNGCTNLVRVKFVLDLTSSLFLSMANYFAVYYFASREVCENRLCQLCANRNEGFYENAIMKLSLKWQPFIEGSDTYFRLIGSFQLN